MLKKLQAARETGIFFKIFLFLTILYIAFQTKPWGSVGGAIFSGDDYSYYGYTSSLVNDFDLDFSNNQLSGYSGISPVTGKIVISHPIGTSILLMPFYIAAKPIVYLLDWLTNTPFDQKHPLFFIFMCAAMVVYMYLGGYLLFKALLFLGINRNICIAAVTLSIWATILPAYAFRRPILSHIPEFLTVSALVYTVIKWKDNKTLAFRHLFIVGLLSGAIIITRWNNIHILFFAAYWLLMRKGSFNGILKNKAIIFVIFSSIVLSVFFLTQSLAWKYFYGSYFTLSPLNQGAGASEIISLQGFKNLIRIFIGPDWGILYTMLPFAAGLIGFFWLNPLSLSKRPVAERIFYLALFSLPFLIVLRWRRQADYYGYRYLLSLLPFACIGLAAFLSKIYNRFHKPEKYLKLAVILLLAFNFFLILPFEYKESTNLEPGISTMGGRGFINNSYVTNAVRIYFTSPPKELAGMFARGFLGGYIFAGIHLLAPDLFLRLAESNKKIQEYYALDRPGKFAILIYPLFVVLVLLLTHFIVTRLSSEVPR